MQEITSYTGLITSEHASRPNYVAVITACCAPFVDFQNSVGSIPQAYDLDTAVGVQLDAIGVRVGVSRNITTLLNAYYFSLDNPSLGLDVGWLEGPYDPKYTSVVLDDTTYQLLLECKIAANYWDGTIPSMGAILSKMFPTSDVFVQDEQDMSVYIGLSGTLPTANLLAIFMSGVLPFAPGGVQTNYVVTPVPGSPIFGLDVENVYLSGLDVGAILLVPPPTVNPPNFGTDTENGYISGLDVGSLH